MKKKTSYGKRVGSILLTLCMALTLFSGTVGVSAETAKVDEKLFESYPSVECFDELWVGDIIAFECMRYDPEYYEDTDGSIKLDRVHPFYPGSEMTVLSGADCLEETSIVYGPYDGESYALECIKPGKATVKVKAVDKNGNSSERTFSLTIIERPADRPAKVTTPFTGSTLRKIGDDFGDLQRISLQYENLNYGIVNPYLESSWIENNGIRFLDYGGKGGWDYLTVGDDRSVVSHGPVIDGCANSPGTMILQPGYRGGAVGDPITIVVEEPVITTNAPDSVTVGSTLNLTTALTNLNVTNKQVSDYAEALDHDMDMEYYLPWEFLEEHGYEDDLYFAYQPSVEILQGADCAAQSEQDYSNTLSTSETLTFQKAGSVKLKITYHQINTSGWGLLQDFDFEKRENVFKDKRYHPEMTVTVRVKYPDQPDYGDINSNGRIDAADYLLLKRAVLGTFTLNEMQQAVGDVSGDNQINAVDYLLVKRHVLGTYVIG